MNNTAFYREYQDSTVPLIAFSRGGFVEGLHRGAVAVVTSDGRLLASAGKPQLSALLRSCAKPFQLTTVLATGAAERFGFGTRELAVSAASHSGEDHHLELVASMLKSMGLGEDNLRCGSHPPFVTQVLQDMAREGVEPSPLRNNCSGKHASMMAACLMKNWPLESYECVSHPLQKENRKRMAAFADMETDEVGIGIDGCTVPTFRLPLFNAALAIARVADPELAPSGDEDRVASVFRAMSTYPELVSGKVARLESMLVPLLPGKLFAKVGAEAFFAVGIAPGVIDKRGVGVVIKLEDGISFNRACDPLVLEVLRQLGVLDASMLTRLVDFYPKDIINCRGETVGRVHHLLELERP